MSDFEFMARPGYDDTKATEETLVQSIEKINSNLQTSIRYASRHKNEPEVIIYRQLQDYLNGFIRQKVLNGEYEGEEIRWE